MATTLFDLEGKVTLDSTGFFTGAESVQTQIDTLATAVGNLETKVSGLKISKILDSATFTAEQLVVTGGLDALSEKVSALKETLGAIDLGGTLLSTVTGGIAALAGNLLVGDIKVGLDTPTLEEIETALSDAIANIESLSAELDITLPDATVDPLASEIATAGTAVKDALEAAAAWEIPVPEFPSFEVVRAKIKAFWQIVTSGLNLSVDATVNISPNFMPAGDFSGGGGFNVGSWTGGGGTASSSADFWGLDNALHVDIPDYAQNLLTPNYQTAVDALTGNWGAAVLGRNKSDTAAAETTSPLEEAVFSALTRWAQPVGGQALAAWMTPQVSSGIAQGTRGIR